MKESRADNFKKNTEQDVSASGDHNSSTTYL